MCQKVVEILCVVVLGFVVKTSSSGCLDGEWQSDQSQDPNGEISCHPCTKCPPGQGVVSECTKFSDTVCENCVPGETFSAISSEIGECEPCVHCSPHQQVINNCTVIEDASCGHCQVGYFYNDLTDFCDKCSYCFEGYSYRQPACDLPDIPKEWQCIPVRNTPYPPPHLHFTTDVLATETHMFSDGAPKQGNAAALGDVMATVRARKIPVEQGKTLVTVTATAAVGILSTIVIIIVFCKWRRKFRLSTSQADTQPMISVDTANQNTTPTADTFICSPQDDGTCESDNGGMV
ncbi:tumor necrosis factor receptor superfamily member 16-like [Ptychodera flava]|uniref:tumor necrosis factor receptor superfamily member 16-like n=1 Tax=Ptychodera flava TaxID=63121 RepID=UPI003969EE92